MVSIQIVLGVTPHLLRDLVCREIGLHPDLAVATASSEAELLSLLNRCKPDAVVVTVPTLVTDAALRRLLARHGHRPWFVIDERGSTRYRISGGHTVELGELSPRELIDALRRATRAAGEARQ